MVAVEALKVAAAICASNVALAFALALLYSRNQLPVTVAGFALFCRMGLAEAALVFQKVVAASIKYPKPLSKVKTLSL